MSKKIHVRDLMHFQEEIGLFIFPLERKCSEAKVLTLSTKFIIYMESIFYFHQVNETA